MGLTLPGPKILGGRTTSTFSSADAGAARVVADDSEVAEVAASSPADITSSLADAPASTSGFADSPAAPVRLPFPTATAADRESESRNAPASFETPPPQDSSGSSNAVAVQPLRIVGSAWASQTAGTPLGAQGVPSGSLPVGTRLAQHDKRSYVRLSGSAPSLVLTPHEDAEGQRAPETGTILACQIIDPSWKEGSEPMTFDAAPAFESEKCAPGVRNEDGAWTFDLKSFPLRTDARGFALIPGPDAPLDFQVAFKAS